MYAVNEEKKYEVKRNYQNEPDPWGIKVPTDLNPIPYQNEISDKLNLKWEQGLDKKRLVDGAVNAILNDLSLLENGIDTTYLNPDYLTPFLTNKNSKVLETARESFYGPLLRQIEPLVNGKPGPIKDLYNALNEIEEHYKGTEKKYATKSNVA